MGNDNDTSGDGCRDQRGCGIAYTTAPRSAFVTDGRNLISSSTSRAAERSAHGDAVHRRGPGFSRRSARPRRTAMWRSPRSARAGSCGSAATARAPSSPRWAAHRPDRRSGPTAPSTCATTAAPRSCASACPTAASRIARLSPASCRPPSAGRSSASPWTARSRPSIVPATGATSSAPTGIVFDRQGCFYVADSGRYDGPVRNPGVSTESKHLSVLRMAGAMVRQAAGSIYYASPDGRMIREVLHPLAAPSGLALSPDETTLYVAEAGTGRIWAFQVAAPGQLGKRRCLGVAPARGRSISAGAKGSPSTTTPMSSPPPSSTAASPRSPRTAN